MSEGKKVSKENVEKVEVKKKPELKIANVQWVSTYMHVSYSSPQYNLKNGDIAQMPYEFAQALKKRFPENVKILSVETEEESKS